jgi:hypothetical protein
MSEMAFKIMDLIIKGEKDRIIEHMFFLILKMPIAIAEQYQNEEERTFCEAIVRDLMRDITRLVDRHQKIVH